MHEVHVLLLRGLQGEQVREGKNWSLFSQIVKYFSLSSLLGCIDHETGVKIIAWLLLAVTAASIVADFFLVSIFLLYWQVVGFIINVSLLYGVKVRKAKQ